MKKTFIILLIIIAIIALGVFWYHRSHQPTPPSTIVIKQANISEQAEAIGSIVPKHSITVKSQLPGIVKQLFQQAGGFVKKGERLLEIKPMPTPQQVATAIEAVDEDQVNITAALKRTKNYEYLIKRNMLKPTSLDYLQAKQALNTAQAKMKLDQQTLQLLRDGHAVIGGKKMQSIITSPIDGFILQRNVDVGDPVSAMGQMQEATALFSIANMKDLIFKGSVDETDAGKLHTGMKAHITVGALPNTKITGTLSKLALQSSTQNAVDNANKGVQQTDNTPTPFNNGFQVEIDQLQVPKNTQLRSGYSANASIKIRTVNNVLSIPERVLIFKDNKTYVMVPTAKPLASKQIEIKIGLTDGMQAQILSGLKLGDKVIDPNPPLPAIATQ